MVNNWTVRQRTGGIPTNVEGNMYGYTEAGVPQNPYNPDEEGLISISSKVSNLSDTIYRTETVTVPALSTDESWILRMAYEEARRSRAMQTNRVNIATVGEGDSRVDIITVYDDDGVTELYRIQINGQDCDNRIKIDEKDYCPVTEPPTPCP